MKADANGFPDMASILTEFADKRGCYRRCGSVPVYRVKLEKVSFDACERHMLPHEWFYNEGYEDGFAAGWHAGLRLAKEQAS